MQDGFLTVTPLGPGGLGTATRVPGAPSGAVPGAVAFLPDGSAVLSYERFSSGQLQLVVRFANGSFGPTYNTRVFAGDFRAFAARAGEVLTIQETFSSVPQVSVASLSLAADGTMAPVGAAVPIYVGPGAAVDRYGTQINAASVALDADGQAEAVLSIDHVETSGNEVLDVHRDAAGTWDAPSSISASLPGAWFSGEAKAAVAPGGRMLVAFTTGNGTLQTSSLWVTLREPGRRIPIPGNVDSLAGAGGALNTPVLVAAGGDGTVALATNTTRCDTTSTSEVIQHTIDVRAAAPGQPLAAYGTSISNSAMAKSRLLSLGAGGGGAIVGVNDQQLSAGNSDNVCGPLSLNGNAGSVSDRATLVSPPPVNRAPTPQAPTPAARASGLAPDGSVTVTLTGPALSDPGAVLGEQLALRVFAGPGARATAKATAAATARGRARARGRGRRGRRGAKPARPALIGSVVKNVRLRSKQRLVVRLQLTRGLARYVGSHPAASVRLTLTSKLPGHATTVSTRAIRRAASGR